MHVTLTILTLHNIPLHACDLAYYYTQIRNRTGDLINITYHACAISNRWLNSTYHTGYISHRWPDIAYTQVTYQTGDLI